MSIDQSFWNRGLSRRSFLGGLGVAAASFALTGCSGGSAASSSSAASASSSSAGSSSSAAGAASGDQPETSTINWARANSGNIFVTLATQNGYFEEYGLTVNEIPVQNDTDAYASLTSSKVDVCSNQGTVMPCQQIAAGADLTMVGGYMLQGMYMVAKKGTTWNGVDDLVGKRIAHKAPQLPVCWAMLEAGHDPMTDITWVQTDTSADRLAAVIAGEADYGYLSGDMLFSVNSNPDVDIVVYADELMPAYGCCRMTLRTDFVEQNPTTMKLLLKALLRAEAYFQANKSEAISILAKQLNTSEDYCAAYINNEHYIISIDPVRNQTLKNWEVMKKIGMVQGDAANIDIDDHINVKHYKDALDEVIAEHGDEYPDWWKNRQDFYEQYNV